MKEFIEIIAIIFMTIILFSITTIMITAATAFTAKVNRKILELLNEDEE